MKNKKTKSNINNVQEFIQEQLFIQDEFYYFRKPIIQDDESNRGVIIIDFSQETEENS